MSKGHLIQSVFFTLKDSSQDKTQSLIDDCYRYLGGAEGIISLHAGPRVAELDRDVNDSDFHVALIVIFQDRQSHDAYQTVEDHQTFVDRNEANWEQVRVFDANS